MQTETTLERAVPAEGNRPFKLYDAYGTEYAVWNQAMYETARSTIGQRIKVTYEMKPSRDGRFENRELTGIEPTSPNGFSAPTHVQVPQDQLPGIVAFPTAPQTASTGQGTVTQTDYQRPKHPDEQRAIRRAVALNNAVAMLPYLETKIKTPGEVLAIAEAWERWLAT